MTNEEAIKMLQTEKACVERQERKQNCNRYCESCDLCMPIEDVIEGYNMAIRALKNEQTDGDLINRTDLLKELEKWDWQDTYLPIHFAELVADLPSAEKTAEWIFVGTKIAKCSNCNMQHDTFYGENYCPNCGAKMKGDTE